MLELARALELGAPGSCPRAGIARRTTDRPPAPPPSLSTPPCAPATAGSPGTRWPWFPPFSRLLAQPGVLDFSFDYVIELLGRFIDWQVCALLLLLFVGYLFLNQWLRLTTLTLLGFAWLGMGNLQWLLPPSVQPQMAGTQTATGGPTTSTGEPDDAT